MSVQNITATQLNYFRTYNKMSTQTKLFPFFEEKKSFYFTSEIQNFFFFLNKKK